ncbi:MAG: sensor histidine kinase [Alphaproteobacteria bacterium]|nr:sensor histidine kinase [Rhodospirillales bacterium]MCW9046336.1 sensor histidine kinase [Alphaproteobacteria bacterium]
MTSAPPKEPRRHSKHRLLSPITRRILTVNILALVFLASGILYLEEYRKSLITTELGALKIQADMFAVAFAEGTVASSSPSAERFTRETARQMMFRLVQTSDARARLFAIDGEMVMDSRRQGGPQGAIQVEELPPPVPETPIIASLFELYDEVLLWLPGRGGIPAYEENPVQHAEDYQEVLYALNGEKAGMVRMGRGGRMVLSIAVPVQRYKRILGGLMLSSTSHGIEEALLEVRLDILKIFIVALAFTVLVSIYLAGTIARPILRLAEAAEAVRLQPGRQETLPDLTKRNDEIGDLSGSLLDMTKALHDRMEAIEGFAADVAHELKNPLTSLRSAVETVAMIKDDDKRQRLMDIILQDVERLDRLINDISDASRLDSELSRDMAETVDLSELLNTMMEILQAAQKPDGAKLRLELPDDKPLQVQGVADRLVQVFQNLVSNALSFTPSEGEVRIRIERDRNFITLNFEDDGPGIPEGNEKRIFERFYTERPAGEAFGNHSGLGLNISKQIIEAHGGTIFAENRHGSAGQVIGARFTVKLENSP